MWTERSDVTLANDQNQTAWVAREEAGDLLGTPMPAVVVAVDARPASADALAWAADEALCRGMRVRIVTAFADPDQPQLPRTIEEALACQNRLHRRVQQARPWLDEAERIVGRGKLLHLLAAATRPGDIVVVGEPEEIRTLPRSPWPTCPIVLVPAQQS
jgi:hypothetical protein